MLCKTISSYMTNIISHISIDICTTKFTVWVSFVQRVINCCLNSIFYAIICFIFTSVRIANVHRKQYYVTM